MAQTNHSPSARESVPQDDHCRNVCMFVFNNFTNDSRVQKEAETLIQAGCQVTVMALLDNKTEPVEDRNGIRIIRVQLNPWHLRFLRWLQGLGEFRKRPAGAARESSRGRISYYARTLFYILLAIGFVRLLSSESVYLFVKENELLLYCLSALLIFIRNMVFRLLKRPYRFISYRFKAFLMRFHSQFSMLSFYCNAYPIAAQGKFDIYHAHDFNTLPLGWFAAGRQKCKLVYDSHELYVERNRLEPSSGFWKFVVRKAEGFLVRRCDAVFTVNESLALELAHRYKIPTPGVVMNTPAGFEKADLALLGNNRLREELSVPADKKLLIYVGSITFNRGLEALIKSLVYLPDCFLVCMGYGLEPFKQSLVDLARDQGVSDRFAFFGPVPTDQVIHYATGADLGVAPIANACLSYYYCSPNKIFEYMNAGLPAIVSNFPELEKVVLGHDIGLSFDPADPRDIARAARKILDDPELARRMRHNALDASGQYNWGTESRKLLKIYESLM